MWSEIAIIALALVTGWLALAPMRRSIGPWGYHTAALPTGLLVWAVLPALTSVLGVAYTPLAVALGHAAFIAIVAAAAWALAKPVPGDKPTRQVPAGSWVLAAVVILGTAVAIGLANTSTSRFDSLFHYHITGIWLFSTGQLDVNVMGEFTTLIPSLHASLRVLGGDWPYIFQPLLSLVAMALLAGVLYSDGYRAIRRVPRIALIAVTLVVLGAMPNWVWHSIYAHSNMATASYLMLAIAALVMAAGFAGRSRPILAWSLVAGLATAGVALARPDGLAFLFLVLALAVVLLLGGWLSKRSYAVACVASLLPVFLVYGAGYLEIGMWDSYKLTGSTALAILVAAVVFAVAGGLASRVPRLGLWLASGLNAVRVAVAGNIVVVSVVAYRLREKSVPEFQNMLGNLMDSGGWGFFWFAAFGIILLSIVFWQVTRRSSLAPYLLYVIFQFFAISLMVFGLTDPGRMAWADSFSRAALHIVPVVFWYVGVFLGGLAETTAQAPAGRSSTESES